MRARSALVPLAIALFTLGGCTTQGVTDDSSKDFQGERQEVAKAVEEFERAASRGDEGKICRDLLTTELVDQLSRGGSSCETTVQRAIDHADTYQLTVDRVTIDGDTASALVTADRGDADKSLTLRLQRQDGAWRLADLGED